VANNRATIKILIAAEATRIVQAVGVTTRAVTTIEGGTAVAEVATAEEGIRIEGVITVVDTTVVDITANPLFTTIAGGPTIV